MVQMVREGSGGGEPPTRTDFMAEYGVSRRTVARDLDFLRDEERAPLAYDEVSIVGNYRTQFDKVIRHKSYEDLVKKMRLKPRPCLLDRHLRIRSNQARSGQAPFPRPGCARYLSASDVG